MNGIGTGEEVFDYLYLNNMQLISSSLSCINIFEENDHLFAELHFKLSPSGELLKIRFTGIMEYHFSYKHNYSFRDVGYCKFLKSRKNFYISLDPYDETEEINDRDQDFILCRGIEGFIE